MESNKTHPLYKLIGLGLNRKLCVRTAMHPNERVLHYNNDKIMSLLFAQYPVLRHYQTLPSGRPFLHIMSNMIKIEFTDRDLYDILLDVNISQQEDYAISLAYGITQAVIDLTDASIKDVQVRINQRILVDDYPKTSPQQSSFAEFMATLSVYHPAEAGQIAAEHLSFINQIAGPTDALRERINEFILEE